MKPDAIVDVRFHTRAEGGRLSPLTGDSYGIVFMVDGEAFDCRLLLAGKTIELGEKHQLPVVFLNPRMALPLLSPAKPFALWEGKIVATGKIAAL